ncbi:hypothetical protein B0J11DRAFT_574904 [Dendryphion nanum]|uniref:Uncharacterized protein n=1 Tax=Dendryphion nanum TaxID=256645 RepID=A0A9P9EKW2_9PLEO|nr:hypothetical protein B0J11DRAFT_574904 [Dendryphion nanum]
MRSRTKQSLLRKIEMINNCEDPTLSIHSEPFLCCNREFTSMGNSAILVASTTPLTTFVAGAALPFAAPARPHEVVGFVVSSIASVLVAFIDAVANLAGNEDPLLARNDGSRRNEGRGRDKRDDESGDLHIESLVGNAMSLVVAGDG